MTAEKVIELQDVTESQDVTEAQEVNKQQEAKVTPKQKNKNKFVESKPVAELSIDENNVPKKNIVIFFQFSF